MSLLAEAIGSVPGAVVDPTDRAWLSGGPLPAGLRDRLAGQYRSHLESQGWDVDLLIRHQQAHQHAIAVAVDERSVLVRCDPADTVREKIALVPGAGWDGGAAAYRVPLVPRAVTALRVALTGHQLDLAPDAGPRLSEVAAAPIPTEVWAQDQVLCIATPHWKALADDLRRIPGIRWADTAWEVPGNPAAAATVMNLAAKYGLVVDESAKAIAAETSRPLNYDLTIPGLAGVPVGDLHSVASVPARGKVASLEDRLAAVDVESVLDLLMRIPLRYIDRTNRITFAELGAHVGDEISLLGRITEMHQYDSRHRMTRLRVGDGTGFLDVTFFRSPWVNRQFHRGDEVLVHGKVSVYAGRGRTSFQMANPMMDRISGDDPAAMVPVYPQSEKSKVSTWDLHRAAMEAVNRLGDLADPIPADLTERERMIGRREALTLIHQPASEADVYEARRRLAFDELLRMQLALGIRRNQAATETGIVHTPTGRLTGDYLSRLPYDLTGAQKRVLGEIKTDLTSPHPMYRLLQGDVGVGKTVVASTAILMAVEGGYQAALMAPTEILATQLFTELAGHLADLTSSDGHPLVVEFLGGKTTARNKRRIMAGLADGSIHVVVGTHALLVDDVTFDNLGLAVVDEQHRFGVEQRAALRAKGKHLPDMLAMTATPIPRTAALTVFGDLAQSVLDEYPPGRTPVVTTWVPDETPLANESLWSQVRDEAAKGRQAYVVASLVEDNEKIAADSAQAAYEALQYGALRDLRVGMVHGQMPRPEREEVMRAFAAGDLDVLVATTVIEVGVNVPNATIMVVLDAPRFGIAQLHQIRGRVGRGEHASRCVLVGSASSDDGRARMEALVASTDGFWLSEVDLELRGSGALFGTRQSGLSDLRVARLPDDLGIVHDCRTYAAELLTDDPFLARRPGLRAEVAAVLGDDAGDALTRG